MLPGQNFIGFGTRTYRPHDYTGWDARRHLREPEQAARHATGPRLVGSDQGDDARAARTLRRGRPQGRVRRSRGAGDAPRSTTGRTSRQRSRGQAARTIDAYRQFGFFGFNMALTADHYPDFLDRARPSSTSPPPIDFWLANIGQRAVWDCLGAIRFWLTNMLVVRGGRAGIRSITCAVERARLRRRSGCRARQARRRPRPDDRARRAARRVRRRTHRRWSGRPRRSPPTCRPIYPGWAEFDLAMTFDDWADGFLDGPEADRLLDRFESFWTHDVAHQPRLGGAGRATSWSRRWSPVSGATSTRNARPLVLPRVLRPQLGQLGDRDRRARALPRRPRGRDRAARHGRARAHRAPLPRERRRQHREARLQRPPDPRDEPLQADARARAATSASGRSTDRVAEVEARIDEADAAMAKFF